MRGARPRTRRKRSFKNSVLGETWVETGEAPDWQRLYERRERWQIGTVPSGGLFLTAGADVQKDRIEVDVWAWGRGLESWLVDHIVIEGGPERAETWSELGRCSIGPGRTHAARSSASRKLAIDTGYEAPAVYAWARRMGHAQVAPIKGVEGFNRSAPVAGPTHVDVTEGGKKLRRGARLWTIAVSTFKSETYRFLRLAPPTDEDIADGVRLPAGYVHLPRWTDAEWVKQLVGRAAGHGQDQARVQPARMAEAARAQRGAGLPGLCPRRGLDRRRGPLDRREMARPRGSARGQPPTDSDPAGQINRPGQAPQGKRRSDWLGRRGGWF